MVACLRHDVPGVQVEASDQSSVLVTTAAKPSLLAELGYVKNGFRVLLDVPRGDVRQAVRRFANDLRRRPELADVGQRLQPFRVMAQVDGTLTSINPADRAALEQELSRATRQRLQPRGMGDEFWVLGRRDLDVLLLGWRLPRQRSKPKPAAGELAPEVCDLLVRASRPTGEDVMCDPFAGSGAIPAARAVRPHRLVWSNDLQRPPSEAHAATLRRHRARVLTEDALRLPSLVEGSVDVVITDPPWGEFGEPGLDADEFWTRFTATLQRVLSGRGRFVVLVARRLAEVAERELASGFTLSERHDVLVNGHPATVVVGARRPASPAA